MRSGSLGRAGDELVVIIHIDHEHVLHFVENVESVFGASAKHHLVPDTFELLVRFAVLLVMFKKTFVEPFKEPSHDELFGFIFEFLDEFNLIINHTLTFGLPLIFVLHEKRGRKVVGVTDTVHGALLEREGVELLSEDLGSSLVIIPRLVHFNHLLHTKLDGFDEFRDRHGSTEVGIHMNMNMLTAVIVVDMIVDRIGGAGRGIFIILFHFLNIGLDLLNTLHEMVSNHNVFIFVTGNIIRDV